MSENKEYIQYYAVNKEKLAELLRDCKGELRTMGQFADECGVSPSMFSRIMRGNITKPVSKEVLEAIFAHKREGSSVTLEGLYRANGMISREERNRSVHGQERFMANREREESTKGIIIMEILKRGYALQFEKDFGETMSKSRMDVDNNTDSDLRIRNDFMLILTEEDLRWSFELMVGPADSPHPSDRPPEIDAGWTVRNRMRFLHEVFLVDAWEPERLKGRKISWVFTDVYVYEAFKKHFRTAKLNSAMSMILVDLDEKAVVREEWMNSPKEELTASIFKSEEDQSPGLNYSKRPIYEGEEDADIEDDMSSEEDDE